MFLPLEINNFLISNFNLKSPGFGKIIMTKTNLITIAFIFLTITIFFGQNKGNAYIEKQIGSIPSSITLNYNDRFLSQTKFGSNADINDHKQVGERLFDERITDRGFEWTKDPNWSFILNGGVATFTQDSTEKYAGKNSLKSSITSTSGSGPAIVIPGIWVEAGNNYYFSFWVKGSYTGGIVANLLDPASFNSIIQSTLNYTSFNGSWTKYSGVLMINKSEVNALLTILFTGTGTLFVDQLSITPINSTSNHISPLLTSAIKNLDMKVMRFPAESNVYDWKKAIGPRDQRNVSRPLISYYKSNFNLGYEKQPLYNDFGIDEFLQMADTFGWVPVIRVNVIAGSLTASNLVEYCNGPVSSTYGAQRSANGHPAPYKVKYWEIGNELWNQLAPEPGAIYDSLGYTQINTDRYIDSLISFSKAMKNTDPTIKIGAIGGQKPSDSYLTNIVDPNWNEDLLTGAATHFDFFGNHYYAPGPDPKSPSNDSVYYAIMGESLFFEREIMKLKTSIAASSNPSIQISATEYAISPASIINPMRDARNMQSVLWLASMKNTFLRQNIELATQFDLLNESGSLLLHTPDTTGNANNEVVIKSGPALLEILYKDFLKDRVIPATITTDSFSSFAFGWMPSETTIPMLEALASIDETYGILTVFVINRNKDVDITADINLLSFPDALKFDTGAVLLSTDLTSINKITNPNNIFRTPVLSSEVVSGPSYFTKTFKKASVTCLQFKFSPMLIEEATNKYNFIAYPNPCGNLLTISTNNFSPGHINVSILNAIGEEVYSSPEIKKISSFNRTYDIHNLPNGIYIIRLQNNENIFTRRIIVNN